jgi:hypothetical protein
VVLMKTPNITAKMKRIVIAKNPTIQICVSTDSTTLFRKLIMPADMVQKIHDSLPPSNHSQKRIQNFDDGFQY